MLHLSNPFFIGSSLLELASTVGVGKRGVVIALCNGLKDPHIKKMHIANHVPRNFQLLGFHPEKKFGGGGGGSCQLS